MKAELNKKNDFFQSTIESVYASLENKIFFKLVCGASLTDTLLVENLSLIFSLAEADVIDLSPRADVIFAARRGIEKACEFSKKTPKTLIMASLHLDKDPHFRKIEVDFNTCDVCGACIKSCPTEAFEIKKSSDKKELIYKPERCYGCNICPEVCHVNALTLKDTQPTLKESLEEVISLGVESIEFHFGANFKIVREVWNEIINSIKNQKLLSFSIGSGLLNEEEIKQAASMCYELAGKNIILQADGKPMSGALSQVSKDEDSLKVAKLILENKLPVYVQLSGGTDQNTYLKACGLGLDICGVAVGSNARKALMKYLTKSDLFKDKESLNEAIKIAKTFVSSVGKDIV